MVEDLLESFTGDSTEIYKVGLHTNSLLASFAEVIIAWQLLRQAEIAYPKIDTDPFYEGKVESARWFLRQSAPQVAARRDAAVGEDGAVMNFAVEAF
jgi:hypothetical protein